MTDFHVDPEDLRRLTQLMEEYGLSEFRYEEGELRITLRTAAHRSTQERPNRAMLQPPLDNFHDEVPEFHPSLANTLPVAPTAPSRPTVGIEAPVMGVFYRSPAPGAPPFVDLGEVVEVGQPVGMIEAMKVFSEILAEVPGRVVEAPAKNGALVQPGEVLLVLEVVE